MIMRILQLTAALQVIRADNTQCYMPTDIVYLQDTTGSFEEDLVNVNDQLEDVLLDLYMRLPNAKFGIAEFKDKPYNNMGFKNDYCYKRTANLSNDVSTLVDSYKGLSSIGGNDVPEAQMHALIQLMNDQHIGWRINSDESCVQFGSRFIIMSTDATPHDVDDYILYNGVYAGPVSENPPPLSMDPFPTTGLESLTEDDYTTLCLNNEYPDETTLINELHRTNTTLIVLIPSDDSKVVQRWEGIITAAGQNSDESVLIINNDSSDFRQVMKTAIDRIIVGSCGNQTECSTQATTKGPKDILRISNNIYMRIPYNNIQDIEDLKQ